MPARMPETRNKFGTGTAECSARESACFGHVAFELRAARKRAQAYTQRKKRRHMIHQKQAECVCFWFLDWVFYHSANLETLPAPGDELVEESGI